MKDANPEKLVTSRSALSNIVDLLESHYLPLLDAIEDITDTDLSSADKNVLKAATKILQRYSAALGQDTAEHLNTEAIQVHLPADEPPIEQHPPITRRPRSKAYDFLLLEGLKQRKRYGHPIGQGKLLELATAFQSATKKGSFISKLNRLRNDKKMIDWKDPEDISLTKAGETERNRLLALVRRDGHFPDIKNVFKTAWDLEIILD